MAQLIKSNGEVTEVKPAQGPKFKLEELQNYAGGLIEKFRAGTKVFVWNENGIGRNLPENEKATMTLYAEGDGFRNVQTIRGDVLVCNPAEVWGNDADLN